MTTITNVNPSILLRRYFTCRERFQRNLHKHRKAIEDLHFNEVLIKSLKRTLSEYPKDTEYPKESDMARRIFREIQTLEEKRMDLNFIVKMRKKIMIASKILTNKYADLYREVMSMNRMGEGITKIDMRTEDNKIRVVGHRALVTGEMKTFQFER